MNEHPLISIIIVNYNGKHFLKDCLESIKNQTFSDFELIIVDNGSSDGSIEFLNALSLSNLKIVALDKNFGFGIANNRGFECASGKYIMILNNDTVLNSRFLEKMHDPIEKGADMVAPLILYKDRPDIIDKAGGHLLYLDGLNRGRGCGERFGEKYRRPGNVLIPDGCAALFNREVIEKCGFFDEDFFLYGEDTDLGLRYLRSGYTCYYNPEAVVYHIHSGTSGKYSPDKAYYVERNRLNVLIKNFPLLIILFSPFFTLIRYFFQAISVVRGKGSPSKFTSEFSMFSLFKTLLKAIYDSFKMAPSMWKKRQSNYKHFSMSNSAFFRKILEFYLSPTEIAFKD